MHVLCSASFPYPASLLKESGSSRFRGYDGCSGRNSVWMTNRAALFARSIQFSSLTVMVVMSPMNPSVDASMAVLSTSRGSAFARWFSDLCLYSFESKDIYGEFRSSVSQDLSRSRSLPRSIAASLTVVYSSGEGVVPKGNHRQMNSRSSTIAIQVDMFVAFAWIQR